MNANISMNMRADARRITEDLTMRGYGRAAEAMQRELTDLLNQGSEIWSATLLDEMTAMQRHLPHSSR